MMENRKKMLMITIPVVVLLLGILLAVFAGGNSKQNQVRRLLWQGDFGEAVAIYSTMDADGELALEICDAVEKKCKKLLRKHKYSEVAALYSDVADLSVAVLEVEEQVRAHLLKEVDEFDVQTVVEICAQLGQVEAVHTIVQEGFEEGAPFPWWTPNNDHVVFWQQVRQQGISTVVVEQYAFRRILENLEEKDYTNAMMYIDMLAHNEERMEEVRKVIIQKMEAFLQAELWADADILYSRISDLEIRRLSELIHDQAYALMEQGRYEESQYLFYIMRDSKDPLYDLDAQLSLRMVTMHVYMLNKQYKEARTWAHTFAGETRQKLQEIFLSYSGDQHILADLETAVLNRLAMIEAGASPREQVDAELEALQQYRNVVFFDEALKQLVVDYLDAVREQRSSLYYDQSGREYYQYYSRWHLNEAKRYQVLEQLSRDYGFAAGNAQIQALLGSGDEMQAWITAWSQIHTCLSGQLWDVEPIRSGGKYYLEVVNDTAHTFTFTVCQRFYGAGDAQLGEDVGDAITLAPGQQIRLEIRYPKEDVVRFTMDWEIFDIFCGDMLPE